MTASAGVRRISPELRATAFGWLVGLMGAKAYLVAAAFAGLGGVLVWLSLRMKQPKAV